VADHAEVHQPRLVLVENVLEAVQWKGFGPFRALMDAFGYPMARQRLISVNAAFVGGTPQCRNRLHMVFEHADAPEMASDLCPPAPCPTCREDVAAVQTWTSRSFGRTEYQVGEFGVQYHYTCPGCRTPVVPYFRSALNVIDESVEAPTLAELGGRLSATMRLRIQKGIERFGMTPMLLINNCTTHNGRVRSLFDVCFAQTGSNTNALLLPPVDGSRATLPEPTWVDARRPKSAAGLRGAVRSRSALIDPAALPFAERLMAGARAAAGDLGQWRLRMFTPRERLLAQGFRADHVVGGKAKDIHLAIGNANPPTVEAELAARAGAALCPDQYPALPRDAWRAAAEPTRRRRAA
jgi:site-specific DNA-cytosine methylase